VSSAPSPRLSSGSRVAAGTAVTRGGDLAAAAGVIRTAAARPPRLRAVRRNLAAAVLLATLAGTLIYLALALTVLVVLRADGHSVLVQRAAFPIGGAPIGSHVFISSSPADHRLTGHAIQATLGVPGAAVVEVLAGPHSLIDAETGQPAGGQPATGQPAGEQPVRLGGEYLTRCVLGACTPGQTMRVPQHHVVGAAAGTLTASGRAKFSAPAR
jgi:hypothetical protein